MNANLRVFDHLMRALPPEVLPLLVFLAIMSIAVGFWTLMRAFRRKLTVEEEKKRDVELAELETVSKLTTTDNRNTFDRWFSALLEESNSKLLPGTAALIMLAAFLATGGLVFVVSDNIPLAIGTGLVCVVLPLCYWMFRRSWRIGSMRRHLPETLEAVGDAIRSGMNLESAIEMTSEQIEEPLKAEFQYANRQLSMGQTPQLVMERMARRIPIPEFRIFTTAVLVHRSTGGNLALLAERLARSARDRAEFQGHLTAISAGSRMSIGGLVIVTALAMLILSGLDVTYLYKFIMNPYGPMLLGITLGLFLVGGFWAWNIMKVRY